MTAPAHPHDTPHDHAGHAHRHGHDHAGHHHGHHGHKHGHGHHHHGGNDRRRLTIALIVTAGFMVVEIVGGWLSGSLALVADAGHMASDAAALALALAALQIGNRPADARRPYGYRRLAVLAAFVNALTLLAIAAWIVGEAAFRLTRPEPVEGWLMLGVAAAGLLANGVALAVLHGGDRASLNLQGAWAHVMGDLLGSAAAILAAGVILLTGWTPIDPLLSLLVAGLIVRNGLPLLRSSAHILIQGAPQGFDPDAIAADLKAQVPAIQAVHEIHAWMLTEREAHVALHVVADPAAAPGPLLRAIKARLSARFGFARSIVQLDGADCPDEADRDTKGA